MLKQDVYQQYSWKIKILLSKQDSCSQRVSEIAEEVAYINVDMKFAVRFPNVMHPITCKITTSLGNECQVLTQQPTPGRMQEEKV